MRWVDAPHPSFSLSGYSELVSAALIRRGIRTLDEARAFLHPDSYPPTPASALPGMDAALERIASALRNRERICIWGDFDVDGQTSTAILVETLRSLSADVVYYIPVRARESHGVHLPRLKEIIDHGAQLVITCDTGITAHEAVRYAASRGVDMVITDHHDLGETLPPAVAVTNPKLLPPEHPLAHLPGAGVAYKLAESLLAVNPPAPLDHHQLLDLVALGAVADLATLRGDTRYLVQKGLQALRNTQRLGLKTMLELAELKPENLTESHIGFTLGPRLNALGRLEDANPAVDLLTTQDPVRARVLATHLEGLNAQRKLLCDQVTMAAEAQLRADPSLLAAPVLLLAGKDWPGGVVGIVAARMVERYGKPAILMTSGADGITRGSARSIPGLHITEAIAAQKDILRNYGGHPMAAGLGLETEKLPEFRKRLSKTVEQMLEEAQIEEATLEIDAWLGLEQISLEKAAEIEQLAPFGPGNERLVLASRNLALESNAQVGKSGEHVRLTVSDEAGNKLPVLWWNGGSQELPQGRFDLAYTIRTSNHKGQQQVTVELVDFQETEHAPVEVKRQRVEMEDWRGAENAREKLTLDHRPATMTIWAEGEHKKAVNGKGRHELEAAETLVIWTTPPYGDVLREVLERVKPQKVILVCEEPEWDFLTRLAGVVKFVVNQRGGRVSLVELAAATGERLAAVRLGLEYFSKRGQVTVQAESDGEMLLAAYNARADEPAAAEIKSQIEKMTAESAAYRRLFSRNPNPIEAV
ncbi:MAG: single-stranded-DNA-specific exonuclease RecJ [Anaerolineales bacterium]